MAQESRVDQLIDFDLAEGQDFQLDSENDLKITTGKRAVLWGLIRRILVVRGSWAANTNFGTRLRDTLTTRGARTITEKELNEIVREAAQPMIRDGRLQEVQNVRLVSRSKYGVSVEIEVIISDSVERLDLEIPVT